MMLTRCPACQTVFRLQPEQLHARRGEVRCGHCFQPFNALDNEVLAPPPAAAAEPPPPAPPAAAPGTGTPPASILPAASALDFEIPEFPPFDTEPAPPEPEPEPEPATPAPAADAAPGAAPLPEVLRSGRRRPAAADEAETEAALRPAPAPHIEPVLTAAPAAEPAAPATPEPAAPPAAAPGPRAADGDAAPAAAHIDIARLDATYGRPPRSARRMPRILAGLAVLALGCTLTAQLAYLFRMEIGRALPGLRPLLVAACDALGCEVPLPRDAEMITIDASDLQSEPGRPGRYLLHATISNRADYAQAWPHLELTLTDAAEAPIARRVLAPAEWAAEAAAAGANAALAARQTVAARLPFDAPDLAPTGYRVYVFYP